MSADQDLEALASLIREHVEAVNSGDYEAVLAQETDDTWYLGPNAPPIIGKEALREAIRPLYQAYDFEISMTTEEVRVIGDWAFEWGRLSGVGVPKQDAEPYNDPDSKYFYLYQKQPDGKWKIAATAYNSNVPPMPPS
jgi:uncharacterized protein (TIGR02246 family)